jgi:hypothetical protein
MMGGLFARIGLASCLAAGALGASVPVASALEFEEVPATVTPASRLLAGPRRHPGELPTKGRTFTFEIEDGFCGGEPKPQIDHVTVVERPKTKERPFKSTVITAYLLRPARERVIPPPEHASNVVYNVCAGLGLSFTKRIKLKRPASGLIFYDGGSSPPRRFWPPVGTQPG